MIIKGIYLYLCNLPKPLENTKDYNFGFFFKIQMNVTMEMTGNIYTVGASSFQIMMFIIFY